MTTQFRLVSDGHYDLRPIAKLSAWLQERMDEISDETMKGYRRERHETAYQIGRYQALKSVLEHCDQLTKESE